MAQDEKYVNADADAGPGADIPEDARDCLLYTSDAADEL